jgi:hypothetical protein
MKLSYDNTFRDLINAYIDATEDDNLTWNQQDQILDEAETAIRQKVETNPDLLDAAPDMLAALERASFELGLCRPGADGQDTADIAGAKELCHQAMLKAKGGTP